MESGFYKRAWSLVEYEIASTTRIKGMSVSTGIFETLQVQTQHVDRAASDGQATGKRLTSYKQAQQPLWRRSFKIQIEQTDWMLLFKHAKVLMIGLEKMRGFVLWVLWRFCMAIMARGSEIEVWKEH